MIFQNWEFITKTLYIYQKKKIIISKNNSVPLIVFNPFFSSLVDCERYYCNGKAFLKSRYITL